MHLRQRGAALLTALFIMTLVAIAATAMSRALQMDIYRSRLSLSAGQSYWASQGVSFWGMSLLSEKKIPFLPRQGDKVHAFPASLKNITPGVNTEGALYDLQARFNLNNLSDKKYIPLFIRLIKNTFPDFDQKQAKAMVEFMQKQKKLQTISEIRMAPGMTSEIYQKLKDLFTVLPEVTPININTASKPVLAILGDGLNESQVNELIESRGNTGFTTKDLPAILQKLNITGSQVTIESTYFQSRAVITKDDMRLINESLIQRKLDKNKIKVALLTERINP